MGRNDGLFDRHGSLVSAAAIAAHASAKGDGFRQRDIKFLIELFSNWVVLEEDVLNVANTQISRYVEKLVSEGFARRSTRQSKKLYRLTRVGLIELLSRIVHFESYIPAEHFFFVYYFIKNYKPRIMDLIESEGAQFPLSLKIELDALLNDKDLVERQIEFLKRELQKMAARIRDSRDSADLATALRKRGESLESIAANVEKKYPYELNSQKPLNELYREIPPELALWELTVGSRQRAVHVFSPMEQMLRQYLKLLQGIQ